VREWAAKPHLTAADETFNIGQMVIYSSWQECLASHLRALRMPEKVKKKALFPGEPLTRRSGTPWPKRLLESSQTARAKGDW